MYEAECEMSMRRQRRHDEIDKRMSEVRQKQQAAKMASDCAGCVSSHCIVVEIGLVIFAQITYQLLIPILCIAITFINYL